MAEVTPEEIVQIVNNFLLSAPPGEFMEVVAGSYRCGSSCCTTSRSCLQVVVEVLGWVVWYLAISRMVEVKLWLELMIESQKNTTSIIALSSIAH
jgi:hypothetical protein